MKKVRRVKVRTDQLFGLLPFGLLPVELLTPPVGREVGSLDADVGRLLFVDIDPKGGGSYIWRWRGRG